MTMLSGWEGNILGDWFNKVGQAFSPHWPPEKAAAAKIDRPTISLGCGAERPNSYCNVYCDSVRGLTAGSEHDVHTS